MQPLTLCPAERRERLAVGVAIHSRPPAFVSVLQVLAKRLTPLESMKVTTLRSTTMRSG
ncbi:hypothetical protein QFZ75_001699 [Streptomyces sp. V3I8]|nr:hypothetical protein [Streptomyces sp. V3I8]MDQ1035283.1 hypothetical protein [Streptomyces sp. V3I8]